MRNVAMSDRTRNWMQKAGAAPAFAGVAPADLSRLLAAASPLSVRDGQAVFVRGDAASSIYLVLGGAVRMGSMASTGKRITVEIFQANDLFGDIAAIDDGRRTADATAMGPLDLLSIPVAPFRAVLAESAPLANNLLRLTTARMRRTYSLLEDASLRTIEQRLAKQMLYLAKLGTVGQSHIRLQVRMHQDELADLLGVTTRSIINVLNKWRAEHLVAFDGRAAQLTILDVARFHALTDE